MQELVTMNNRLASIIHSFLYPSLSQLIVSVMYFLNPWLWTCFDQQNVGGSGNKPVPSLGLKRPPMPHLPSCFSKELSAWAQLSQNKDKRPWSWVNQSSPVQIGQPSRLRGAWVYMSVALSHWALGFPGGSDGKESTGNVGDPNSIPGSGRPPGEEKDYYSSILAWRIPWTESPGRLHSRLSKRVGHGWATNTSLLFTKLWGSL